MTAIAFLLTFGSGATDVASFTRLGNVFTSVMTGNIVLLGLAAARGSVSIAAHTAVSFAGYVIGVAVAARITHASRSNPGDDTAWPPHVTATLILEFVLLAAFAAGWEITNAAPTGGAQFPLLAIAAAAMGIQAVAVRGMDLADLSTTYLTGTLTGLIGTLANLDRRPSPGRRSGGVLLALLAGAGLSGLLIATVPTAVPALPIAALLTVLLLGSGTLRLPRSPAPRSSRADAGPE
jgi:uncharacterized membrane protein YoaK (UPF0700 family)